MSRGGRQKFGVEFIDQKAAHRAWGKLPLGKSVEVWVMMNASSVKTVVGEPADFKCPLAQDQELVGYYNTAVTLVDFMHDVAHASEVMMRRSWRVVA